MQQMKREDGVITVSNSRMTNLNEYSSTYWWCKNEYK